MPAVSRSQARFFRYLEHSPDAAAEREKSGLSHQQLHDFAATPDKGLPERASRKYYGDGQLSDAFAKAGDSGHSLHASLHVPEDETIPVSKVKSAAHSNNPHLQRMAQAAINMNRRHYYAEGAPPSDGDSGSLSIPEVDPAQMTGLPKPLRYLMQAIGEARPFSSADQPGVMGGDDPVQAGLKKANAPWWAGPALAVAGTVAGKGASLTPKLLSAIKDVEPRADSGGVASISALRQKFPALSKEEFDDHILGMAQHGEVGLHEFAAPLSLPEQQRQNLLYWKRPGAPSAYAPNEQYFGGITIKRR